MHADADQFRPIDGYRVRASIDWVEVLVTLLAPSQFRHVKARAPAHWGKLFVDAVDDEASSYRFRLRIQNPGPPTLVFHELQGLSLHGPIPAENVAVVGLEIAVDFTPRTTEQRAHLAQVAAYLHEHMAKPPDGPHLLRHSGRFQAASGRQAVTAALGEGWSLTIGAEGATDSARVYRKDYDTQDGESYRALPPAQHCARMERTLTGKDCPFNTLANWRTFKFETLAERFAMVLPTPDAAPLTTAARAAWGPALGKPDDPKKRASHRRQSARATKRDTVLNGKIRQALRDLTRRTATAENAEIRCAT